MKNSLMYFAVVFAMVGVACCAQAPAAVDVPARLDSVAKSYTSGNAFMGSVLVVDGDHVMLDKGYGLASVEWNIPDAPDVKFRLGSLTKQFTATLVLLLQEDGKLHIGDPVSKYLPDAPKAWEKITLAELLGHTSGIPNFTDDREFGQWRMNSRTPEQLLAFFRDKPLTFEPGSKFSYSNSNFEVLGAVIEKVSGQAYGELLRTRIFEPLGMKNSGLDSDELVLAKRAQGYVLKDGKLQVARSESMTVPWAAGSIYSTTGDLLLWERGLFGGKILNEASLKAMTTPGKGEYGLGVFVAQMKGLKTVLHGGGIEGFNTQLIYIPDRKIAIVVLANVNGSAPQEMADKMLTVMLGQLVILDSERKVVPIAKAGLEKFAGVYDLAPTFAITIAVSGESLTAQGTGQTAFPLSYEGLVEGHPRFAAVGVKAEIEFIPDAGGVVTSLVLHQGGEHPAKKR